MPHYSPLEKFGLYAIVWLIILIPSLIITVNLPHSIWFPWPVISLTLTFIIAYKYNWKLWGWNLFTFDKNGLFLSSNSGPMYLRYTEIKTVEILKESNNELYGLHIVMQKGEVIATHFLSTSQNVLEEFTQMIITQSLSKDLIEKPVKETRFSKLYDRCFTKRLNRKNFLVGITICWLLFLDLILITYIVDLSESRIYFAYVFSVVVWGIFFISLTSRREHDLGYSVNELSEKQKRDIPLYWMSPSGRLGALLWLSVQLAMMESAQYENQYGSVPKQQISIKTILGLDRE